MSQKLTHGDAPRSDEKLTQEAAAHLAKSPPLQLMTELLTRLRDVGFPWWTPEHLRDALPATDRMRWYAERPDLRQRITTDLTGLAPKAARNKTPDFQASLIDSVIDDGDISVEAFDSAFEPGDLSVYGPAADFWSLFRLRMPWDDDSTAHQDLIGWLLGALLADKSSLDGTSRTPILTPIAVRTAIDGRIWHTRIPLDVRVAIDNARFAHLAQKSTEPFGADRDLAIATPALIAASVPLTELSGVFDVAGAALGFEAKEAPVDRRPSFTPPASVPPRPLDRTPKQPEGETSGMRSTAKESSTRSKSGDGEPGGSEKADPPPTRAATPRAKVPTDDQPSAEENGDFDELEHTNPWIVPASLGDVAANDDSAKTLTKTSGKTSSKTKT